MISISAWVAYQAHKNNVLPDLTAVSSPHVTRDGLDVERFLKTSGVVVGTSAVGGCSIHILIRIHFLLDSFRLESRPGSEPQLNSILRF